MTLEDVFKPTWHLAKFEKFEDARSFAIEHGWRSSPQKVQVVKRGLTYFIEPFEGKDCNCPGIIPPH